MTERAPTAGQGIAIVAAASVAFSTSSPLARLARPAHPMLIACGRVLLAALLLGVLGRSGLFASVRALSLRDRARVGLAGVLLAAHFACFQWGLDLTSLPAAVSLGRSSRWRSCSRPGRSSVFGRGRSNSSASASRRSGPCSWRAARARASIG
jgi:hypothetical protein